MVAQRRNISAKSPIDINPTTSQVYQQKHPIHAIYSSLPTVVITGTISFFIHFFHSTSEPVTKNALFYATTLSFMLLCGVFIFLQVNHVSYQDWKKNQTTSRCIHLAAVTSFISIIGYHIIYWKIYGYLTTIFLTSSCALIFSILSIITSFI